MQHENIKTLAIVEFTISCGNNINANNEVRKMDSEKKKNTNRLINETSTYLLQHAYNPVEWYPWGEEAFEKAREENKLVVVSIGYSACHWCHVMEYESFEDEKVAEIMNRYFINIKVDREERPDVDNIYMDAVHLMGRQGGWPLNCIALPDGRPVFGGTYFPKESWLGILTKIHDVYVSGEKQLTKYAENLEQGIKQQAIMQISIKDYEFSVDNLEEMIHNWKKGFNMKWGGNVGAPKFPMPNGLSFLLQYYYFSGDEEIKKYLEVTLDRMAAGGIYDHIGGGFARYSTDEYWKVPHFEKMLYDNAQLISVYSEAYKLFGKERYREVVYETTAFLNREMKKQQGGYCSAIDADSEGEEGKYYVWTLDEIVKILGENAKIYNEFYSVTEKGNWEEGINVLHNEIHLNDLVVKYEKPENEIKKILKNSGELLLNERYKRVRPVTDSKVITSWNALLISGYVSAYKAFGDEEFLDRAKELAEYLYNTHVKGKGTVKRMLKANSDDVGGFLDDYALLAQAYIDLYEVTFNESWLYRAEEVADRAIELFFDIQSGMFYYHCPSDSVLFSFKQEIQDNVIPSSNSSMANVLYKLGLYFEKPDYTSKAEKMLSGVYPNISKYGAYFANWGILLTQFVYQAPEIVFVGAEAHNKRKQLDNTFVYANIVGSTNESELPLLKNRYMSDKTLIYVCRNKACKLPVENVNDAIKQIEI